MSMVLMAIWVLGVAVVGIRADHKERVKQEQEQITLDKCGDACYPNSVPKGE